METRPLAVPGDDQQEKMIIPDALRVGARETGSHFYILNLNIKNLRPTLRRSKKEGGTNRRQAGPLGSLQDKGDGKEEEMP